MTLEEILAKKEKLVEDNKKQRLLIDEAQTKIADNKTRLFKLSQEEQKLLYKNKYDVGAHFIKIDSFGCYHADLFTIYKVNSVLANGTIVKVDKIIYRIDDNDCCFSIENSGSQSVKSITNDGFMFLEEDKVNTLLSEAMKLNTKEVINILVEIKNNWGQE